MRERVGGGGKMGKVKKKEEQREKECKNVQKEEIK